MTRFTASKAELTPKYRRHFNPRLYSRACSRLFYLNISPSVVPRPQQRASFSRFPVSVFFTVSPSSPSPHPLVVLGPTSLSLQPPRLSRRLSLSLYRVPATPCRSTLLYDSRYFTLLPSSNDYLCLRAKREMKAKLFDTADFPLSLSLFSFSFFRLSLSLSSPLLRLPLSPSYPLSLYTSIAVSLFIFPSLSLPIPLSLSRTLPLHSSALFPSLAYTLAPPFLPTAARLPSSFHPSNFSTPFTKIKINSSTTCPGTMPETLLPSSVAAYAGSKRYIPTPAVNFYWYLVNRENFYLHINQSASSARATMLQTLRRTMHVIKKYVIKN